METTGPWRNQSIASRRRLLLIKNQESARGRELSILRKDHYTVRSDAYVAIEREEILRAGICSRVEAIAILKVRVVDRRTAVEAHYPPAFSRKAYIHGMKITVGEVHHDNHIIVGAASPKTMVCKNLVLFVNMKHIHIG